MITCEDLQQAKKDTQSSLLKAKSKIDEYSTSGSKKALNSIKNSLESARKIEEIFASKEYFDAVKRILASKYPDYKDKNKKHLVGENEFLSNLTVDTDDGKLIYKGGAVAF
jgi:hypothetical protein